MLFEPKGFYVDLNEVVEIYNSNKQFSANHMDKEKITNKWILEELESMKETGFHSCKIIENSSEKIIGVMDFKLGEETYLSLLMIHNDYKSKGLGKLIFQTFVRYVNYLKSKCIRINVVTNYNSSMLNFWIKNGFIKFKDVELNWTGKSLSAVTMKEICNL